MTSLAFNAAPIDVYDNSIDMKRNKTIKRYPESNSKVENMRKQLGVQGMDSENELTDFTPPSSRTERDVKETDLPVNIESFNGLPNTTQDYQVPYFDHVSVDTNKELLLHKLDYMIHLLEEQRDVKTGSVTEEVILYSFLGVFIIFVLDSFTRAGKYTR